MTANPPTLSVGLPVYNGENFIAEAIESVLSQTFQGFELVISDNSSTDDTRRICEHYESLDDRIIYHRVEQNKGAAWNFNRVFELSSGKYFKWLAHDDLIQPQFLAQCVQVLEEDLPRIYGKTAGQEVDQGGFASTVWADDGCKRIRTEMDIHPIHRRKVTKGLSEALGSQEIGHG